MSKTTPKNGEWIVASPFGDRLKEAIAIRELTRDAAIAKLHDAGVKRMSRSTFYRYLDGRSRPNVKFLEAFCQVFGVSADYLLTGKGPIEPERFLDDEQVEMYGLRDLPEQVQTDVLHLAVGLFATSNKRGLSEPDIHARVQSISRGLAAWLRMPLHHSDKLRRPRSELEAIAFCGQALQALKMLAPEVTASKAGDRSGGPDRARDELSRRAGETPGGPDRALNELADAERRLHPGGTPVDVADESGQAGESSPARDVARVTLEELVEAELEELDRVESADREERVERKARLRLRGIAAQVGASSVPDGFVVRRDPEHDRFVIWLRIVGDANGNWETKREADWWANKYGSDVINALGAVGRHRDAG